MLPLIFLFFFFCSVDVTTSFPADADLSNCTQNFECGPFRNLTYPFTGGARPSYCGPPEFHFSCIDDTPELTIAALSYRVLKLDPVHQNLTLARYDLWNSTCTDKLGNSTLESEFFTYDDDDDMDVTIFYGCNSSLITPKPENWFFCDLNLTFDDAYYVIGPAPLDPIMSGFKCSVGITVPILKTTAAVLVGKRSLFGEAIKTGFNVHYTNPYEKQCAKCLNVNGLCGFDSDKNRPVCICGNRVCNPAGTMDNGNFVVKDDIGADQLLYQSFDHLCDTLLRSQLLGYGINSGTRTAMTSWKSESDPSTARLQDRKTSLICR